MIHFIDDDILPLFVQPVSIMMTILVVLVVGSHIGGVMIIFIYCEYYYIASSISNNII